jgi:hypothetical protein
MAESDMAGNLWSNPKPMSHLNQTNSFLLYVSSLCNKKIKSDTIHSFVANIGWILTIHQDLIYS